MCAPTKRKRSSTQQRHSNRRPSKAKRSKRASKKKNAHVIFSHDLGNGFAIFVLLNPRLVSFAIRRFLFHAMIHNNTSQEFFVYRIREHIYQFSSLFASIHRGSLFVGWVLLYKSSSVVSLWPNLSHLTIYVFIFSIRSLAHTLTLTTNWQSLSNYARRAERHCFIAALIVCALRLHEKPNYVRTKKIIKSATGSKELCFFFFAFARFAIIPLPILIPMYIT